MFLKYCSTTFRIQVSLISLIYIWAFSIVTEYTNKSFQKENAFVFRRNIMLRISNNLKEPKTQILSDDGTSQAQGISCVSHVAPLSKNCSVQTSFNTFHSPSHNVQQKSHFAQAYFVFSSPHIFIPAPKIFFFLYVCHIHLNSFLFLEERHILRAVTSDHAAVCAFTSNSVYLKFTAFEPGLLE